MLVDLLIVAGVIGSLYRGRRIGFVRQLCSTAGFFGGLLLGAWLGPHLISRVHSTQTRAMLTILITFGTAAILVTAAEYVGLHLKRRVSHRRVNKLDNGLGSLISAASLLLGVWLVAAIVTGSSSLPGLQSAVRSSRIVGQLDKTLPSAPGVIAKLGRLIDPNGFPDVFIGNEPAPRTNVNLPALGDLATAVNADKASVVRIQGQGCGGIVSGSGFVAGSGLVATNAHVVAGINRPYVQDAGGNHRATVVWFDPDLDFAVLKVGGLAGHSLKIKGSTVANDTPAAVLGYPGGGDFSAKPAVVLDQIEAAGRDIYGGGHTLRQVYELRADVIPGNSGGALVGEDGQVIGVIFAESTAYNHVGYALTGDRLGGIVSQAAGHAAVTTGRCAE